MSQVYIVRLNETNVKDVISRIEFSEPEINSDYGNQTINVCIKDEEGKLRKLVVETPMMKAPFGLSEFEAQTRQGHTYKKYSLPVSFDNLEDSKQAVYKTFIEMFDQRIRKSPLKTTYQTVSLRL